MITDINGSHFTAQSYGSTGSTAAAGSRSAASGFKLPEADQAVSDTAAGEKTDNGKSVSETIAEYKEELLKRIKSNDTGTQFAIGNKEYSIKEWDKMIERFDEAEADIVTEIREREERLSEEDEQKKIAELFEDRKDL